MENVYISSEKRGVLGYTYALVGEQSRTGIVTLSTNQGISAEKNIDICQLTRADFLPDEMYKIGQLVFVYFGFRAWNVC